MTTSTDNAPAQWWLQCQRAAAARFAALPMPGRQDPNWRFAGAPDADLASYQPAAGLGEAEREQALAASDNAFATAGGAVFGNEQLLSFTAADDALAKQGVIFEPLTVALARHPDLLQKHFMSQPVALGSEKFAALHRANCNHGILLYVPAKVRITLPLTAWHWLAGDRQAVFPHTLIIAEAGSEVTFADFYRSLGTAPGLAVSVTDLLVGAGARVTYLGCQDWNEQVRSCHLNAISVGRDAGAKTLNCNLGGASARVESHSRLTGVGARSEMLGLSVGHGAQEFDQRTRQDHRAPRTWSDLLYKNILNHRAKAVFAGLIKVAPGAPQTDAYQTNRNLLLSDEAEADSMPGLEIANDDVKCSHGATTGQIDPEALFYLLQRGIPRHEADYLLAVGFTEEVLARFGHDPINTRLRAMIADKFRRGKRRQVGPADDAAAGSANARHPQHPV
ncbi:MAG: Fe-S cluster assembly protein SufD [Verrucomicrobiales bacterium]|jgi:Fe-S cluster assembly protein SufD|nr:Fe-S cluster assembly protein SufD [Verrucomicrobiales bacterium]